MALLPKEKIRYFRYKKEAEEAVQGCSAKKMPNGMWAATKVNDVAFMQMRVYLRVNGEVS